MIRILPWPCWPWPFWSTFGWYIGPLRHLHAPQGPTCGTILQPSHLGYARPSQMASNSGSCMVRLCALAAHKPAHGHDHGQKAEKNEFWRKLRHKSDCCCFGWAVYATWACYMNLRALYVFKLAKFPLTCLADLAGDRNHDARVRATCHIHSLPSRRVAFFFFFFLHLNSVDTVHCACSLFFYSAN